MKTEMPLHELLQSIRAIFAADLDAKPLTRRKPVADPALWRAIQNQQRNRGDVPISVLSVKDS